jgi:hypothetical protein
MKKFLLWGGLTLLALFVIGIVIASVNTAPVVNDGAAPSAPSAAARTSTRSSSLVPDEGTLVVGTDIKPGTYRATVPSDSLDCYWARLKDTSGNFGSIIANGIVRPGGRVTVTIKKTDGAFETTGCGGWRKS